MARLGSLPDQALQMIQRGNNRGAIVCCEDDNAQYRRWLAEALNRKF